MYRPLIPFVVGLIPLFGLIACQKSTNYYPGTDFLGMHIHQADKIPFPSVQFGSWRLWDSGVGWKDLEPQPGQWQFNRLDTLVKIAQQHKKPLIYVLGLTPAWASARPDEPSPYGKGAAAEPKTLQTWRNYVAHVVRRYKGKIQYIELWNEPNYLDSDGIVFYTGSISTMVTLAAHAYQVIKAIDPTIRVISPSVVAGFYDFTRIRGADWLAVYFQAGGGKYCDIIGTHLYLKMGHNQPEKVLGQIDSLKATLTTFGQTHKPIWNTETGFLKPHRQAYTDQQAIATVLRTHLITAAQGISRYYWYSWDNRNFVTLYFVDSTYQHPTPAALAYDALHSLFSTYHFKPGVVFEDSLMRCILYKKDNITESDYVVWSPDDKPRKIKIGHFTHYRLVHHSQLQPLTDSLTVGAIPVLLTKSQKSSKFE